MVFSRLGLPSNTDRMFCTATTAIRSTASRVTPATCGAAMKLSRVRSGLSCGGRCESPFLTGSIHRLRGDDAAAGGVHQKPGAFHFADPGGVEQAGRLRRL